jgi:hypothetical protein
VDGKTSDEDGHEDNKSDAHQEHGPPELCHPLGNGEEGLLIEQQVLESGQRTFGIDLSALEEDIAVALKVVARRSGP